MSGDNAQLEFALSQKRVIFTQDTDFMRMHQTGTNHAGIVYLFAREQVYWRNHQRSNFNLGIIRTIRYA